MDDHYHFAGFHAFQHHDHDIQLYAHAHTHAHAHGEANALSMPDAMMGYVPDIDVKGHLPVLPWRYPYPPPPPASGLPYWSPATHFDESIRSVSPQSDSHSQSTRCYSSLSYDDATPAASGFMSSPSPSYHEMPVSLYEQEPVNISASTPATEPQPMLQSSPPMFAYSIQYTSPSSSSPSEPSKPPRKTPIRKVNTRTRVQKRSMAPKKSPVRSKPRATQDTATKPAPKKSTDRRFECCFSRYGCTSTFPNKNEWKRHVSSQHIQPGFYRCDIGRCSLNNHKSRPASQIPSSSSSSSSSSSTTTTTKSQIRAQPQPQSPLVNDFNRKDLFIQHQRRMHAPWIATKTTATSDERAAFETSLEAVWKRCWTQLRLPPTLSRCGFCGMEFRGEAAWKERMEHVARHLEKADPGPEREDVPLREWAVAQGILGVDGESGRWKLRSLGETGNGNGTRKA
ncbi:hypothetical protein BJX99DRAFT_199409 [Aspergillus californicus]